MTAIDAGSLWREGHQAPTGPTRCSHCMLPMNVVYAGSKNTELDFCPLCDLVWLDTGEWADLERTEPKPKLKRTLHDDPNASLAYARVLLQMEMDKQTADAKGTAERISFGTVSPWKHMVALLGVPAEEDTDFFLIQPWITWLMIILCLLISQWAFRHPDFLSGMAFVHSEPFFVKVWSAFSTFFVHGGWLHLLGNMYFLWIFGDNVEDHLGKIKYLLLLFAATACGSVLFGQIHADTTPLVGASGGIFGLITYYLLRFPKRRFVIFFFFRWYAIPGLFLGALFFVKELFGILAESAGYGGVVAHSAHVGGALVGAIFAFVLSPQKQYKTLDMKS